MRATTSVFLSSLRVTFLCRVSGCTSRCRTVQFVETQAQASELPQARRDAKHARRDAEKARSEAQKWRKSAEEATAIAESATASRTSFEAEFTDAFVSGAVVG